MLAARAPGPRIKIAKRRHDQQRQNLDEQALEAVRQWKFEPAQRDGKPVLMHAVVEVNFRIL